MKAFRAATVLAFALAASTASAQTIKLGFISSYSGLNANLVHFVEVELPHRRGGGEEIQDRLYPGQRLRPRARLRGSLHQELQRRRREDRRQRARAAAEPRLGGVHAARQGREARRADGL